MFLHKAKTQAEREHRKATARLAAKQQQKDYYNHRHVQQSLSQPYSLPSFSRDDAGPESHANISSSSKSVGSLNDLDSQIQKQKAKVGQVKDGTIQVPLPKWRDNTNRATVRFLN